MKTYTTRLINCTNRELEFQTISGTGAKLDGRVLEPGAECVLTCDTYDTHLRHWVFETRGGHINFCKDELIKNEVLRISGDPLTMIRQQRRSTGFFKLVFLLRTANLDPVFFVRSFDKCFICQLGRDLLISCHSEVDRLLDTEFNLYVGSQQK